MQVSFHLRQDKIKKSGLAPIRMLISANGFKYFKVIKDVDCLLSQWDKSNQRIKRPRKNDEYNYYIEYNEILDETENKAKKLFRYILINNISPKKEFIAEEMTKEQEFIKLTNEFFPSWDEFIAKGKNIKAESTLKKYQSVLNYYQEFEKSTGYVLTFDTITVEFFEEFRDYCFEERETLNNYFAKLISILKTFMNWSYDRGYHKNLDYKKFKASEEEIEVIYLTMEELMTLYKHDFKSDRLNHVRDIYCFGSFTGLRYSDLSQLKSSNIFKDDIVLNIKKTKTIAHKIPLNKFAKEILKNYRDTIYEPLPIISDVKFNEYIKECCEIAKIDTPTSISRWIGQRRIDITEPKYKFITSHTARKTFVTNSLVLGMKEMVVRNISGHKKESSFRRYVKIAEDLKKSEMDNAWNTIESNQ